MSVRWQGWAARVAIAPWQWVLAGAVFVVTAVILRLRSQVRLQAAERWRERRMREELEAYARLETAIGSENPDDRETARALARRVCRTIADYSVFQRVAMLRRNPEGRLACLGSVGVDDLTIDALHRWAEKAAVTEVAAPSPVAAAGRSTAGNGAAPLPGSRSFSISLGEWHDFDPEVGSWAASGKRERRRWRRAIVAPVRAGAGRMLAAIVLCADGTDSTWTSTLSRALGPIEVLAARLGTGLQNAAMADRLLRAEKLAGLGQLAGGVAHALNNPLTAVLGFSELIRETAADPRVRQDAGTILTEALKMKDTVQKLIEFWRPSTIADEPVQMGRMLTELASACDATLARRGVQLELTTAAVLPPVRGSADRLRQVFEHLLNNAAQAVASVAEPSPAPHVIRLTASADTHTLHVIVSDSGPGFREPARVFDPFYTTAAPGDGAGLGLSICYGIVREHGGEISAFNLHPCGAAVVVELPLRRAVESEPDARILTRENTHADA